MNTKLLKIFFLALPLLQTTNTWAPSTKAKSLRTTSQKTTTTLKALQHLGTPNRHKTPTEFDEAEFSAPNSKSKLDTPRDLDGSSPAFYDDNFFERYHNKARQKKMRRRLRRAIGYTGAGAIGAGTALGIASLVDELNVNDQDQYLTPDPEKAVGGFVGRIQAAQR